MILIQNSQRVADIYTHEYLDRDLETGYQAYKSIEKKITQRDIMPQTIKNKVQRVFKCKEARFKNYKPINSVTVGSSFNGKYAKQVLESFTTPST